MDHQITLTKAEEMTVLYRENKETILATTYQDQGIHAICETFAAESIYALLDQEGCKKMRIYYGMSIDLKMHAIIVGVNEDNEDMLPSVDPLILEESQRCPDNCPPSSPLNPA